MHGLDAVKHSLLLSGLGAFAALLLCACAGPLFKQAQSVIVTAVPRKVADCRIVGPVQDDHPGDGIDDRMLALKEDAVRRGGNTVLIRSFAASRDGTAYVCQPTIKPDNAS